MNDKQKTRTLLILFVILTIITIIRPEPNILDTLVSESMTAIRNSTLITVMIIITDLMSTTSVILITIIMSTYLIRKKDYQRLKIYLITIISGFLSEYLLKAAVMRARPNAMIILQLDYSYPSGHSVMAVIMITLITELIGNSKIRKAGIILIGLIAFSRLYLNVHWLSDVAAGILLGLVFIENKKLMTDKTNSHGIGVKNKVARARSLPRLNKARHADNRLRK